MILEIVSSAFLGSISFYAFLKKSGVSNDSDKLNKIFTNSGLNIKEADRTATAQLVKKKNYSWGTEYRYRIPLGRSFDDYKAKFNVIQDGLNHSKALISLSDVKTLSFKEKLFPQLKALFQKKRAARKEIELSYDGLLKVKVYNEPMPDKVNYTDISLKGDGWKVPVGQIREGNVIIYHDFEKIPHLVVGGATRYGKSNFLNMLIVTLLSLHPDDVTFTLIDLKGGVEFWDYESCKQVLHYAEEPEEAAEALKSVVEEMRGRQADLKAKGFRNVQEAKISNRHFIIIDEVGELNPEEAVDKKDIRKDGVLIHKSEKTIKEECQMYISQIARLGAGLGYRQILATQYPTGDVIPRQAKQNSDAKLCFRVQDGTASRVVLGSEGAENLPQIKGRAIYQTADKRQTLQTPMIEPATIKSTAAPHIVIKAREEKQENDIEIKRENGKGRANLIKFEQI